ncbi:acyl-CoA--6-aminopenicillanic acid acyl-transferase, partial [Acinetobacter baumannii]|nr:acyl-CoA--6-aminopenicillanic acid acyl-transferase [Acinetobacter baumannii]
MRAAVQAQFPLIWQELEGMAEGLQAPVDEVFAWNCRGDLVRSTSDGCTTLAGRSPEGALIIAHNED